MASKESHIVSVKEQFRKSDRAGNGNISEEALAQLIRKLCGDMISIEVIQALFASFDGGTGPRGSINYNDFIDWLFESLEPGAAGGAADTVTQSLSGSPQEKSPPEKRDQIRILPTKVNCVHLFCSHQHTVESVRVRQAWIGDKLSSVKVSAPPFNTRLEKGKFLPDQCKLDANNYNPYYYNVATFGAKLPRVIMELFASDAIKELSKQIQIPIPKYALDSFVQKKMPKVKEMIKAARQPETGLNEDNMRAVDKLEAFCNDFQALDSQDGMKIQGPDDWEEFVRRHVGDGWQDNLHFDIVLVKNFSFSQEVSDKLRTMTIEVEEKGQKTDVAFEHHALRWLTKAFKGYGPVGCLTDVVNLVYAMTSKPPPTEASEEATIKVVQEFKEKLDKRDFKDLWIPTHLAHDAETDDALSWLLLEYVHRCHGSQLEVLIQLPQEGGLDPVAQYLETHPTSNQIQVFRDVDSSNGKPINATWKGLMPAVK